MTTKDAVRVARIMVHHSLEADRQVASLLMAFPEVDWVEFFNQADDFLDTEMHDKIFDRLEELRSATTST